MNSYAALGDATARVPVREAFFRNGKGVSAKQVEVGRVVVFKRNQTIFDEGDKACYSYRVVDGVVRQCVLLPDGRRQVIDFLSKGDVLGLTDVDRHDCRTEAVTDVILARIPKKARLDDDAASMLATADNLRSQLCRARFHAIMLGRQTVKERVASFLVKMAERDRNALIDGVRVELPMGRQDIADYLGLTLETVCRTISALKRGKVIDVPNTHEIIIRNAALLEGQAECHA